MIHCHQRRNGLRKKIGEILRELCKQQGVELVEGHAMPDHVHLCLSISPKFSVANTVGFIKGKSAIRIHCEFLGRQRNFTGFHFWARGCCASTVGLDDATIRQYIRHQEAEEKRQGELSLEGLQPPSCSEGPFEEPSSNRRLCRQYLILTCSGGFSSL